MNTKEYFKGSLWKLFLGFITETTKEKEQRKFRIFCPDLIPSQDGDVTPEYTNNKYEIQNVALKTTENVTVKVTKTIEAYYLGFMYDRSTPYFVKGQRVLVFNLANSDKYYFVPFDAEDSYKAFSDIRFRCPDIAIVHKGKEDPPDDVQKRNEGLTDDNTYFIEIDTLRHKHIRIQTAATDGETHRFFMHIDAAESAKSIKLWTENANDSNDRNIFEMYADRNFDKKNIGRIVMTNAQGTSIDMDGPNMRINVPGDLTWKVEGSVTASYKGGRSEHIEIKDERHIYGSCLTKVEDDTISKASGTPGSFVVSAQSTDFINQWHFFSKVEKGDHAFDSFGSLRLSQAVYSCITQNQYENVCNGQAIQTWNGLYKEVFGKGALISGLSYVVTMTGVVNLTGLNTSMISTGSPVIVHGNVPPFVLLG